MFYSKNLNELKDQMLDCINVGIETLDEYDRENNPFIAGEKWDTATMAV